MLEASGTMSTPIGVHIILWGWKEWERELNGGGKLESTYPTIQISLPNTV